VQDDEAASAVLTVPPAPAAAPESPAPAGPDRLLHSDPHDFAGLYIRHRSSFTLHARRYLHDPRDADEVVQEAFLRLFLALPELETELQALAYCRRTITNLCIDRYRAQARRPRLVDLESVAAEDLADEDPGDPVVRAEDAALVRDALSMLSPLHRAALVKREIEEKPLPVIAEELEIAEDSVKHVLFRARRALRRLLAATSLAPGSDAEGDARLGLAKAGSSGLAALLMLVVLGLGSGPNLQVIPVVGSDLPDLPGVTDFAKVVGEAVTGVSRAVTSSGTSSDDSGSSTREPAGRAEDAAPGVPAPGVPAPEDAAPGGPAPGLAEDGSPAPWLGEAQLDPAAVGPQPVPPPAARPPADRESPKVVDAAPGAPSAPAVTDAPPATDTRPASSAAPASGSRTLAPGGTSAGRPLEPGEEPVTGPRVAPGAAVEPAAPEPPVAAENARATKTPVPAATTPASPKQAGEKPVVSSSRGAGGRQEKVSASSPGRGGEASVRPTAGEPGRAHKAAGNARGAEKAEKALTSGKRSAGNARGAEKAEKALTSGKRSAGAPATEQPPPALAVAAR
jgi:RNA polymerase sigma factor (sigma-70 family)